MCDWFLYCSHFPPPEDCPQKAAEELKEAEDEKQE
jgi:hypothetical protein